MSRTESHTALYMYAIGPEQALRRVFDAGGLAPSVQNDSPVALVTQGRLAAVVSEVPLDQFGEGKFEENLKDPLWIAEKLMRHEKLTEFLASRTNIVPLRFGVMYSSPDRVRDMLDQQKSHLNEILNRLKDREEWGLNIRADRKTLSEQMVNLSPSFADMQKRTKQASPGQAYLLERKLDSMRSQESKLHMKRMVQEIRASLAAESYAIKDLAIREIDAKQEPPTVGKLSFLIDRNRLKSFQETAEAIARKYSAFGVTLELTGPWPPYNFSE